MTGSEVLSTAVGAVSVIIGFIMGRMHRPEKKPTGEICQCEHGASTHDKEGCHASISVENRWDALGNPNGWRYGKCACVRYVGPSSSYVPELDG